MSRLDPDRWEAISLYLEQALHVPEDTRPAWLAALREQNPSLAADLFAVAHSSSIGPLSSSSSGAMSPSCARRGNGH